MKTPPARPRLALLLALPLLAGCGGAELPDWLPGGGGEDAAAAPAEESAGKFVTVTVGERVGIRIKDPLGQRVTGATCGIWKDDRDHPARGGRDRKGECCWSMRGECACPCPDR